MQTNAEAEQACFKASDGPHPPLKTPVQKDTPRETKKNIQLHYNQIKTIQAKTLVQKDTPRETKHKYESLPVHIHAQCQADLNAEVDLM